MTSRRSLAESRKKMLGDSSGKQKSGGHSQPATKESEESPSKKEVMTMNRKRVMLMIECQTNLPIALLRQKGLLMVEVVDTPDTGRYTRKLRVLQVQANVIKGKGWK